VIAEGETEGEEYDLSHSTQCLNYELLISQLLPTSKVVAGQMMLPSPYSRLPTEGSRASSIAMICVEVDLSVTVVS